MAYPRFYYDNRLSDGTPAASSTDTGYDVLNLQDFRAYTWWRPATMPATVTVDCGSPQAASSLAVWGHDLYGQGATIEVRGSTDNFASSDVLVNTYTPTSNSPFIRSWTSVSYRYWRIRLTGNTNPSIAIIALGVPLEMPAYLEEGFDPSGRNPEGMTNRSVQGHALGRVIEFEEWSQMLNFRLVSWSWLRATWEPAWTSWLRDSPFIFAWESEGYPTELRLVTVKDKYQSPHRSGQLADLMVELVGVIPSDIAVATYDPAELNWLPAARAEVRRRRRVASGEFVRPLN